MNITPDNFSSVSKQLILTNTDLFIDLISDPQYFSYHNQKLIDDCFILACEANNLDIVKYLLHPHTGSYTANIHYDDDCGLRKASYHVYLEIVDYLLSSPELITHANIHSRNEACLEWACEEGRLELVQYLTTSPKLKEHANVNAQNGIALTGAINSSHSDVALFLLTDDKLKNTINPFIDNHAPFFTACDVNCQPLIDYYLDLYQTTPELITELISDAAFAKFEDHTPTIKIVWNLL
jgi:ankyrin repeat protein